MMGMMRCSKNIVKKIFLLAILAALLPVGEAEASGGEEMEGSALEEYLLQNGIGEKSGLGEMDYALFLDTNLGIFVTGHYHRYGIYGDFAWTQGEGEKIYFALCEKILGVKLSMEEHEEWVHNEAEYIYDVSPDLCWTVSRDYDGSPFLGGKYVDTVTHDGNIVLEVDSTDHTYGADQVLRFRKADTGRYELEDRENLKIVEQLVKESWKGIWTWTLKACMDEYGRMVAVSEPGNTAIRIYDPVDGSLIRRIEVPGVDSDFPLEISQFSGTGEEGWLVFSNGKTAYRMAYPDGKPEQLGEFMFDTTFSPDGKYLAYFNGMGELDELWLDWADDDEKLNKLESLFDEWKKFPFGWYIREIETGNTVFIPIETWEQDQRPLCGGRCVWIEKDKLLQLLNQ